MTDPPGPASRRRRRSRRRVDAFTRLAEASRARPGGSTPPTRPPMQLGRAVLGRRARRRVHDGRRRRGAGVRHQGHHRQRASRRRTAPPPWRFSASARSPVPPRPCPTRPTRSCASSVTSLTTIPRRSVTMPSRQTDMPATGVTEVVIPANVRRPPRRRAGALPTQHGRGLGRAVRLTVCGRAANRGTRTSVANYTCEAPVTDVPDLVDRQLCEHGADREAPRPSTVSQAAAFSRMCTPHADPRPITCASPTFAPSDLTITGLAAQVRDDLVDVGDTGGGDGMTLGLQTTGDVDRLVDPSRHGAPDSKKSTAPPSSHSIRLS